MISSSITDRGLQDVSSNIRTSVHADPSDVYNSSCSKDPAWLFMTLFYASSRFDLHSHVARGSGRRSPETTAYLLQAIASVNMAIAQSPFAVTDSALATVACLANIEVCHLLIEKSHHVSGGVAASVVLLNINRISMALWPTPQSTSWASGA